MNAPAAAPLCGMDSRSVVSAFWTCSSCSSAESWSNSSLVSRSIVVGVMRSPFTRSADGLREPVLEAGRGDACIAARSEGVGVELGAEVLGVDVGPDSTWVVLHVQQAPDDLVEAELLGTSKLDDSVYRLVHCEVGQRSGDV